MAPLDFFSIECGENGEPLSQATEALLETLAYSLDHSFLAYRIRWGEVNLGAPSTRRGVPTSM